MSDEEEPVRRRRVPSPLQAMRKRLRAELDSFYRDMSLWNGELASLTERWQRYPEARADLRADFSRLRGAIEHGRKQALRRAEEVADGQPTTLAQDADRASSFLLKRLDEAMHNDAPSAGWVETARRAR